MGIIYIQIMEYAHLKLRKKTYAKLMALKPDNLTVDDFTAALLLLFEDKQWEEEDRQQEINELIHEPASHFKPYVPTKAELKHRAEQVAYHARIVQERLDAGLDPVIIGPGEPGWIEIIGEEKPTESEIKQKRDFIDRFQDILAHGLPDRPKVGKPPGTRPENLQKKARAISLREKGLKPRAIAEEIGMPRQTVERWLSEGRPGKAGPQ